MQDYMTYGQYRERDRHEREAADRAQMISLLTQIRDMIQIALQSQVKISKSLTAEEKQALKDAFESGMTHASTLERTMGI